MNVFLVVTGIVGLGIGVWFGMPGRYTQSADDIDKIMDSDGLLRRRARKTFSPFAWMSRKVSSRNTPSKGRRQRSRGPGFKIESPDDR